MASCKYNHNHAVPPDRLDIHEAECRLRSAEYSTDDQLLPEPFDAHADTLVTLSMILIPRLCLRYQSRYKNSV